MYNIHVTIIIVEMIKHSLPYAYTFKLNYDSFRKGQNNKINTSTHHKVPAGN